MLFAIMSICVYTLDYNSILSNITYIGYDPKAYFSKFSELKYFHPYAGKFRHPFVSVIFLPFTIIFWLIGVLFSEPVKIFSMMLLFNLITATIVLVLYKYFVSVIKIQKRIAFLLCLLYISFGHIMLLISFPEIFQISVLGLLILVYITTDNQLNGVKVSLLTNIFLFCFITGTTVSNGMKCVVAQLFQKASYKSKFRSICWSGGICFGIIVVSILCSTAVYFYFNKSLPDNEPILKYLQPLTTNNVFHKFLFEPILFHDYSNFTSLIQTEIYYSSNYHLSIVIGFFIALLVCIFLCLKESPVLLLLSFFGIDILIHIICKFGINEAHIYSPHWLFIIPLLIGCFYKWVEQRKKNIAILNFILVFFLINFLFLNGLRMFNFFTNYN